VLIVEDDPATVSALRMLLTRKGCKVRVARTISDAFIELRDVPDVVILDLMLPDGSGVSVLRHVREQHLKIRVAVTTATSDQEALAEVERLSPESLMRKPIDVIELYRALEIIG